MTSENFALYEMREGDLIHGREGKYEILRVPGGWMYTTYSENGTGGYHMSSCFVPFNNEFMPS